MHAFIQRATVHTIDCIQEHTHTQTHTYTHTHTHEYVYMPASTQIYAYTHVSVSSWRAQSAKISHTRTNTFTQKPPMKVYAKTT